MIAPEKNLETIEEKSALIIVTHNHVPNFENLVESLDYISYILMWDNDSSSEIVKRLYEFSSIDNFRIQLILNDENIGLSRALNKAVGIIKKLNVRWLYFIDHDALIDVKFFEVSKKIWQYLKDRGLKLGLVVPIVTDEGSLMGSSLSIRSQYSFIKSAITSGMMIDIHVFDELNGFDESFFVYGSDIEFSERLRAAGYKICRLNKAYVVQHFGEVTKIDSSKSRIRVGLSTLASNVTLKLNMINAHHTVPLKYSTEVIRNQDETTKRINRIYKRSLLEVTRLTRKYIFNKRNLIR